MSRLASGDKLQRIQKAFREWLWRSDAVRWDDKEHIHKFLAELERTGLTQREILRQLQDHTNCGGRVKEQDNPTNHEYSTDIWYAINLPVGGRELFVKFVFVADENEFPGLLIVNIHW